MNKIARWIVVLFALGGTSAAYAQSTAAITNHCYQGGTQAKVSGLMATNYQQGIIPSCTVTVYLTGTTTKATIYKDSSGTTLSNPFMANASASTDPGGWIFWAVANNGYDVVMSGGVSPNTYAAPVTITDVYPGLNFSAGGANLPAALTVISGDGTGNGVEMPEKGTSLSGSNAVVAWDEDWNAGIFDARNTAYAGGIEGATPGAALEALRDRVICYESLTGLHPTVTFPPGKFAVGTASHPSLTLPTGAYYKGASGLGFDSERTQFNATYNNTLAVDFEDNLTSYTTCSDGNTHTASLVNGQYDGFRESGCGYGGCVNAPGDSGSYPSGGPLQVGVVINDQGAVVGKQATVWAADNGADGIEIKGSDSHAYSIGGSANNYYFYYGMDTPGQSYQFSAAECHGEVVAGGTDNQFLGQIETYGTFMTPGIEYGHVAGICFSTSWGTLTNFFPQVEEIDLMLVYGETHGTISNGRLDLPRGSNIRDNSLGSNNFVGNRTQGACLYNPANDYFVHKVTTATPGSGQNPGTYLIQSTGVTNAYITVTVGSGGTVTTNPVLNIAGRGDPATPVATFTMPSAAVGSGTGATFTVSWGNYQMDSANFNDVHCGAIWDDGGGANIYSANHIALSAGAFGATYPTNDAWLLPGSDTFVGNVGSATNSAGLTFDLVDSSELYPGRGFIVPVSTGKTVVTGSTLNLNTIETNVAFGNTIPITLTSASGGYLRQTLEATGDGYTTMPYCNLAAYGSGQRCFGAQTCTGHALLLQKNVTYQFRYVDGQAYGLPVVFTQICNPAQSDWSQWNYLGLNGLLPNTYDMPPVDVAGDTASRTIPLTAAPTITCGSQGAGAYTYTFGARLWVAGSEQVTNAVTESCRLPSGPPPDSGSNVQLHMALPNNWTRYQLIFQSSTDPSVSAMLGVLYDVTAPSTNPQPATTVAGYFFYNGITPVTPGAINSAWIPSNMTGTHNTVYSGTIPQTSSWPGTKGQVIYDCADGYMFVATADDTWERTAMTCSTF